MNHNVNEEKTENPTEHKIKKFRQKGKTKYSRELNSLLILLVGFISLWYFKETIFLSVSEVMLNSFCFNNNLINDKNNLLKIFTVIKNVFFIFLPFLYLY